MSKVGQSQLQLTNSKQKRARVTGDYIATSKTAEHGFGESSFFFYISPGDLLLLVTSPFSFFQKDSFYS